MDAIQKVFQDHLRRLPQGAAFVVDRQLVYLLAGGDALAPVGLSPEIIVGKRVHQIVPQALVPQAEKDYQGALAGAPFIRPHAVGERWFITHGMPIWDSNDRVIAALAVSYDATGRYEAGRMEILRADRDLHFALAEALSQPLEHLLGGIAFTEADERCGAVGACDTAN